MTAKEKKRLLNDRWPNVSEARHKALFEVLKKASKAKIFEYKEDSEKLVEKK